LRAPRYPEPRKWKSKNTLGARTLVRHSLGEGGSGLTGVRLRELRELTRIKEGLLAVKGMKVKEVPNRSKQRKPSEFEVVDRARLESARCAHTAISSFRSSMAASTL
jgi:hypothetical protein